MRRKNWEIGNVVEIALKDGSFSYGAVIEEPLMIFSKNTYNVRPEITLDIFNEISFKIWVMKYAVGKKGWPIVGSLKLNQAISEKPIFYKYDIIAKKFFHCSGGNEEIPASFESCKGMECAAVWDPEHIESRLQDEKNNVANIWVESLKAESHV